MRDMREKGRSPRGIKSHRAKFTEGQIRRMKEMAKNGVAMASIAQIFQTDSSHISKIVRGLRWAHIP